MDALFYIHWATFVCQLSCGACRTHEYAEFEAAITAEVVEATSNFGMRFYAPTAFHGAHVVIGVLLALQVLYLGSKGFYDDNPIGVELFGLYWHFVDVVWILLFTLIYLV